MILARVPKRVPTITEPLLSVVVMPADNRSVARTPNNRTVEQQLQALANHYKAQQLADEPTCAYLAQATVRRTRGLPTSSSEEPNTQPSQ